ncbi:expressed unknown protein [Seminavis robusta]|uniref:Uncharacterized protein n=1 Tax=Seminavis robusta TaxID=568900 RepID=A0A9N8EPQ0_9STRA|nr:expressed unknown protein [Seminavis robusta]|eukprot:Sro1546_g281371.1  (134) ;mRNA; f:2541-2942
MPSTHTHASWICHFGKLEWKHICHGYQSFGCQGTGHGWYGTIQIKNEDQDSTNTWPPMECDKKQFMLGVAVDPHHQSTGIREDIIAESDACINFHTGMVQWELPDQQLCSACHHLSYSTMQRSPGTSMPLVGH